MAHRFADCFGWDDVECHGVPADTTPRIRPADLAAGNPGGRIHPAIRPIKLTAKPVDSVTESPRKD